MVISSEFRMGQYRDGNHRRDSTLSKMLRSYVHLYFKAFPSLYVIGVRPIGQELLSGPWCKSNHKDWNKPCKGKPHLAPVWECLGSFHFWPPYISKSKPKINLFKGQMTSNDPSRPFLLHVFELSGIELPNSKKAENSRSWKISKNLEILEMKPKK